MTVTEKDWIFSGQISQFILSTCLTDGDLFCLVFDQFLWEALFS